MLIVCPSCASEYAIDPERVGAQGRTVRCAACRTTWFAGPEPAADADAAVSGEPSRDVETVDAEAAAWIAPQDETQPAPISVEAQTGRAEAALPAAEAAASRRSRKEKGRKARPPRTKGASSMAPTALLAILVIGAALTAVFARASIVRHFPETARLYAAAGAPVNLVGLDLKGVRSELALSGADAVLIVEGDVTNSTGREMTVPRIEIAVRGRSGETLYTWTNEPPRQTLGPAETARFSAKLASPPADARQVLVRFAAASGGTPVAAKGH